MMAEAAKRGGRRGRTVSRVVLTIEPESLQQDSIDVAVRLARTYGAELVTVFVKGRDLFNLASLPFGATVISRSGQVRRVDPAALDDRLELLARQARERLARAAGSGIRWSFRTATGYTEQIAAGEAAAGDLLTICSRTARGVGGAADALACSLLLLGRGMCRDRPVVALFEGDTALLAVAREMAAAFGKELVVLVALGGDAARRRRSARAWLARRGLPATVRVSDAEGVALAREIAALAPGLLVAGRAAPASRGLREAYAAADEPPATLLVS